MLIRRATLQVLAQLGRAASTVRPADRRAAYSALDPLLRGVCRRRVVGAVASALHETEHGRDEAHVHRLAYLRLTRAADVRVDHIEDVRRRFTAVRTAGPSPLTAWVPRVLLVVGVPLLAGALWLLLRPPASVDPYATAEVTVGAFSRGGRPAPPNDAQRRVMRDDLGNYLVALDAFAADDLSSDASTSRLTHARQTLEQGMARAFGVEALSFLTPLLDQNAAIVLEGSDAFDSHTRATDALNAAFARLDVGVYVDMDVRRLGRRRRVIMSSFEVEHVSLYRSGSTRVSAMLLRRLDRLAHDAGILGYTRAAIRDALVLAEPIEGNLVTEVLPTLGDAESFPMVDPITRARGEPWVQQLESVAARTLRSALGDALPSARSVRPLAALFERRRTVFEGVDARLGDDLSVRPPRSYRFDRDLLGSVSEFLLNSERAELSRVESELEAPAQRELWARLFEVFVASVEHHEVQHRLDHAVDESLGEGAASRYEVSGLRERAGREFSAYLAQIARDGDLAPSTLTLLANHAFDLRAPRGAYRSAAVATLRGLADELGLAHTAGTGVRGREALSGLYMALVARPPSDLNGAAQRLWERLFLRPLPPLERVAH